MTHENKLFCKEHSEHTKCITKVSNDVDWIKKLLSVVAICVILPLCLDGVKFVLKNIKIAQAGEVLKK